MFAFSRFTATHGPRGFAQRQQNPHAGAARALIIRFNASAVLFHDFLYDRKPQASTLRLAGDVGIEDRPDQVALKSRAVVGHHDLRYLFWTLLGDTSFDFHACTGPPLERFERIGHQIVQNLANADAVRGNGRQMGREREFQFGGACLDAVQIRHFGNELIEIETGKMHVGRARILAEGIDHLFHRFHLGDDGVGRPLQHLGVFGVHAA